MSTQTAAPWAPQQLSRYVVKLDLRERAMTQSTDWLQKQDVSVTYTFNVFRFIDVVISSPQCVVIPKVIIRYHGDPCTTRYHIHFSDALYFTPHEEFKSGFGSATWLAYGASL